MTVGKQRGCLIEDRTARNHRFVEFHCRDMIEKHGICVRALGDLSLLPVDVQRSIARVMKFSRKNKK